MDFHFIPDTSYQAALDVPYFEDARADFAPYSESRNQVPAQSLLTTANTGTMRGTDEE